jgi:hypothetical protein
MREPAASTYMGARRRRAEAEMLLATPARGW